MSRTRCLVLVFFVSLLTVGWTVPLQQEGPVVVGRVINGSVDGLVPADLEATLHVFSEVDPDGRTDKADVDRGRSGRQSVSVSAASAEIGVYTTAVSSDGSFRFDDLVWEGDVAVVVRVIHQGVPYLSEFAGLEPGQRELSLPIEIYESTGNLEDIQVDQLHIFATRIGERLQVSEYHRVSNLGDRAYVGSADPETGRRITLAFALPEGATGLSFEGAGLGERFVEHNGGFADTVPIVPGRATGEVFYHYTLPYREDIRVERVFQLPVASIVLVLPGEAMAVEGDGIAPAGSLETEGGLALSYKAGPLAAGEPLVFTLVPATKPAPDAPSGTSPAGDVAPGFVLSSDGAATVIGLTALCVAVIAAYVLLRPEPPPARARPLIEAIAVLDAEFEAGRVTEEAYRRERMALKKRVRALM